MNNKGYKNRTDHLNIPQAGARTAQSAYSRAIIPGVRPACVVRLHSNTERLQIAAGYRYAGGPIEELIKRADVFFFKFAKRLRELFLYILFGIILLALLSYIALSPKFSPLRIRHTEINGADPGIIGGIEDAVSGVSGSLMFAVDYSGIEAAIMDLYPAAAGIEAGFRFPFTLVLDLVMEEGEFYTAVGGDYFILSETLRVLDYTPASGIPPAGLTELILPPVSRAVMGAEIELFADWGTDYIKKIIAGIKKSGLDEEITAIYAPGKFNSYLNWGGIHKIFLGTSDETAVKLNFVISALKEDIFNEGKPAVIDVSNIKECSVIFENNIDFN